MLRFVCELPQNLALRVQSHAFIHMKMAVLHKSFFFFFPLGKEGLHNTNLNYMELQF